MARTALSALRVNRDHEVNRGSEGFPGSGGRRAKKGKQVPRVNRGLKVIRGNGAHKASKGLPGNRGRRASRGLPGNRARRERKGKLVPRVFRDLRGTLAPRGRRGQPGRRERLVYRVNGVPPGTVQRSASQSSPVAIASR